MPESASTAKPCCPFWPTSAIAWSRGPGRRCAEHVGGVERGELHLAGLQQLQCSGPEVSWRIVDVEGLLLEEALLLRHVGADERQVRLGLEAGQERHRLHFERAGAPGVAGRVVVSPTAGSQREHQR